MSNYYDKIITALARRCENDKEEIPIALYNIAREIETHNELMREQNQILQDIANRGKS